MRIPLEPDRQFKTDRLVFVNVPKFELTSQVPLYIQKNAQPNQSTSLEGKIPLEDWSKKELLLFKDELTALKSKMRETRCIIHNESKHIKELRDKAVFPIVAITEQEFKKNPSATIEKKGKYII